MLERSPDGARRAGEQRAHSPFFQSVVPVLEGELLWLHQQTPQQNNKKYTTSIHLVSRINSLWSEACAHVYDVGRMLRRELYDPRIP